MSKKLTINSLYVKNFKGIKEVKIVPEGNVILITGMNGAGKTSVIEALFDTLAGGRQSTVKPIREGETRALVEIVMGDYRVEKIFAQNSYRLDVYYKGEVQKKPQEVLNDLIGNIGFDVRKFMDKSPKEQKKMLMELVGLNFDDLNDERAMLYEKRTAVGNAGKALALYTEKEVAEAQAFKDKKPENVAELVEKWKIEDDKDREKALSHGRIEQKTEHIEQIEERIRQFREQILSQEKDIEFLKGNIENLKKITDSGGEAQKLQDRIQNIQATNDIIAKNKEILANDALVNAKRIEYTELSAKIKSVDDSKLEQLLEAKMPLKGLSIEEDGITYNGIPFGQLSTSEQLDVSLAMAMGNKNTDFKVLRISDGDKFDENNLKKISEAINKKGWEVWIERVSSEKRGFHIVDGELEI